MLAEHVAVLLLAAVALLVWPERGSAASRRLPGLRSTAVERQRAGPRRGRRSMPEATRRLLVDALAAVGVALLLGPGAGLLVGTAAGVAVYRLQARGRRAGTTTGLPDLPLACDLLALCLQAGLPVPLAVDSVAAAVAEPLRSALEEVAGRYRLGAEPSRAWADVPAALSGMGRALVRAGASGSGVAAALHDLASDRRAAERSRTETRVRQAGVWLLAPLGACFLPAFLCLGVVPLVLGIAGAVFG